MRVSIVLVFTLLAAFVATSGFAAQQQQGASRMAHVRAHELKEVQRRRGAAQERIRDYEKKRESARNDAVKDATEERLMRAAAATVPKVGTEGSAPISKNPRDKLVRQEPLFKGPSQASPTDAPPAPNPWYHGDKFGYMPYGHTSITNWNVPASGASGGSVAFFRGSQMLVRVDNSFVTFVNTTTGVVLSQSQLMCIMPKFVIRANDTIGYYACADNNIVIFDVTTQEVLTMVMLPASNQGYNVTEYPYFYDDSEVLFELVPHLQQNMLIIQVSNPALRQESAQIVYLNPNGTVANFGPLLGNCPSVDFIALTPQAASTSLSALVVCSGASYYHYSDPLNSNVADYTKSFDYVYYRSAPNIQFVNAPPGTMGPRGFYIASIAFAYMTNQPPANTVPLIAVSEIPTTPNPTILTNANIQPTTGQCGSSGKLGFAGPGMVIESTFLFTTPCGLYGYLLSSQSLTYSISPGNNMVYSNLFWGGRGFQGATSAGALMQSVANSDSAVSIFDATSGSLIYRNTFTTQIIGIAHSTTHVLFRPPGLSTPLDSPPISSIAINTGSDLTIVNAFTGTVTTVIPLRVNPVLPPVFLPESDAIVVVGTDYSLMAYGTALGIAYFSDDVPSVHEGITFVTALAEDYFTYVFAIDQAGRLLWRSDRAFTFNVKAFGVMRRYVMVEEGSDLVFLDVYTGQTIDVVAITTNCAPTDPHFAERFEQVTHSADHNRIYFTANTKCLYSIGQDLTLSAYTLPLRTNTVPVLDDINGYAFVFAGYVVVALDTNNNGAVLWQKDLDNAPLAVVPLSQSMDPAMYVGVKPDYVYVLTDLGVYALNYRANGQVQWVYLINGGNVQDIIISNLLIFNQAAYIKHSNTILKLSLDPTLPYNQRVIWNATAKNDEIMEQPLSETLIATPLGKIIWVGGNDIMVFNSANGLMYYDKTDSCADSSYGNVVSYDKYLNILAVNCANSVYVFNMSTGMEILGLLNMANAVSVTIQDGVLIAANGLQVFIQAVPPRLLPEINYLSPLNTIAPASTFAPLASGAPTVPAPTIPPPAFNGVYNAPPPLVSNVTQDLMFITLRWNMIFGVNASNPFQLLAYDAFTFALEWNTTLPEKCAITATYPMRREFLSGVIMAACSIVPNELQAYNALLAFNAKTGALKWSNTTFFPLRFHSYDENSLIVQSGPSTMSAFNIRGNGSCMWSYKFPYPPLTVIINHVTFNSSVLVYIDNRNNLYSVDISLGQLIMTTSEIGCNFLSPVLASGQQATQTYSQRDLPDIYYMCDSDLKRWNIQTGITEDLVTFEGADAVLSLFLSTNFFTPVLMVTLNTRFLIYNLNNTFFQIASYTAPAGGQFFGNAAYLVEESLAIATYGTNGENVNFVALNVNLNTTTNLAEGFVWTTNAGGYNYLVVSNTMASASMLPDGTGNFVYLNGGAFVLSSIDGMVNTQLQGTYTQVDFPKTTTQFFIEGPEYNNQTQTRLVVAGTYACTQFIADPMLDNSPDSYGWSYSGVAVRGFDSYTDCVTGEHFTLVFDDDGIVTQVNDAGYTMWHSNGQTDSAAPMNIFAVSYISGKAVANNNNAPNGYVAIVHDHGVTFVKALDGSFVVELLDIMAAGIPRFENNIEYLIWGDSVYIATNDYFFRFEPFGQTMKFIRLATFPLEYITTIGIASLDGSIVVLNSNLGTIIAVNTNDMETTYTSIFALIGAPVSGFAPVCANRTAVIRGSVNVTLDYFITYSELTSTFTYLRFSDLMVMQMMTEVPEAVFTTTTDCYLLVWSQDVIAKFDNVLVNGQTEWNPIWSSLISFDGGDNVKVQFQQLPNVGLVALCGANGEYFTINYVNGSVIAHFTIADVTIVYSSYFSAAGQGVWTPMVADVIFVDTDYGGAFVRATTGEYISRMLDMNMDIVLPVTPTNTYLYLEFGTLLTLNPVALASTPINPSLNLQPVSPRYVTLPTVYSFDPEPVITVPFDAPYTNGSFAMRIWAQPLFNESTQGIHYAGSFVTSYQGDAMVVALVTVVGQGFLQFLDAPTGAPLRADIPISYDGEQETHWIGRLSASIGAYCTNANMLIGFSLSDVTQAATPLFSTLLPGSVILQPPYANSDVPNVPVANVQGDKVTCMLLSESNAVCVNSDPTSANVGNIIVSFLCHNASDIFYGPIFTDKSLNIVVFSCHNTVTGMLTMSAFDLSTGNASPNTPKWVYSDPSGTVAGVDGTTNNMVVFVASAAGSGAYLVPFATGTPGPKTLFPGVTSMTAMDGWEYKTVYAIFSGPNAQYPTTIMFVGLDLTNNTVLWSNSGPDAIPFEPYLRTSAIISSLDQTSGNLVSIVVVNSGAVCALDVDTGVEDWCVLSQLATTAQFVQMYEDGYLLWGQPTTNFVEFRNLLNPNRTWFLSANTGFDELAHSLYTFQSKGLTHIHRAFDTRLTVYVAQTETSVIYPNYNIVDVLTERYIILSNPKDSSIVAYDSLIDAQMWAVQISNRANTFFVIAPSLYAPNGVPQTVLLSYTHDSVVGLNAKDGSLDYMVNLPVCTNGDLSPIQASYWDDDAGNLYLGYDTCLVMLNAATGDYTVTDVGSFIGRTITMTEHCLLVVSIFGEVSCYPIPAAGGTINPTKSWSASLGLFTRDFDINQYGSYIAMTWSDNLILLNEINGQQVFQRVTSDRDVKVEIFANFLVSVSDDGITVTDLSISTTANQRVLLNLPAASLVPNPTSAYLSPSKPLILPWGVAVVEIRQRVFGINLATLSIVFNASSYSTIDSFKQQPCNYIYTAPSAGNSSWQGEVQTQLMTCDGNTYSALDGSTYTQAPPLTFAFTNQASVFPNGQSASQFVIGGYLEGSYISELPFSYLKFVAIAPSVPAAMNTNVAPTGTLPPNFPPQNQFTAPQTLPAGVTLPGLGCVIAIENQRVQYDACIEQIILLQQLAGTSQSAQCSSIASQLTQCATNWVEGMGPDCQASTEYLVIAVKAAASSDAFPWCNVPSSCADGNSSLVCQAIQNTIALNVGGGTPYPIVTIPTPAGQPPAFSTLPAVTMPAQDYVYFSFTAIAPQQAERFTVETLPFALVAVLGLAGPPQLIFANFSASTFDFIFADPTIAYQYSKVLAQKIVDNRAQVTNDLRLIGISFTPYGPINPPTPTTTTAVPTTQAPSTTQAPFTTPGQMTFYAFHCGLQGSIPNNLAMLLGALLDLTYDPAVTIANATMSSFDFTFTNYYAAGTLSGQLYAKVQANPMQVAQALQVRDISASQYTPPAPTTLPPSPEDSDDVRPAVNGAAAAGIAILVIVATVVGGLLVYVFVIKGRNVSRRDEAEQMDLMQEAV